MDVPRLGGVVEAAPVPDLLGSILSGQSVLLSDSSDVVINRDGSLKATKPMIPFTLNPSSSKSCVSGDPSTQINPGGIMPNVEDSYQSFHYNGDLPGYSHSTMNRFSPQSSDGLPSFVSSAHHTQPLPHSPVPPRGYPNLLPPHPNKPTPISIHRETSDKRTSRDSTSSSIRLVPDSSSSKNKGMPSSQSQPNKAPTKPMWVDVSVLPRIPKIRREGRGFTDDDDASQSSSNTINSSRGSRSNSTTGSNGNGTSVTGMNSLAGDKSGQQSVDHQKGSAARHSQRHWSDETDSSSTFSSSFSSSSSTSYPVNQPRYSSSSSAVSFRINSSRNSWHSRHLSTPSFSVSGGSTQEHRREKEEEARKKQLHKDKQMLLASRSVVNKEQDSNNIYDPFNPTLSDSSISDGEDECSSLNSSQHATQTGKTGLGNKDGILQSTLPLLRVKTETQELEVSKRDAHETKLHKVKGTEECVKVKKESRLIDIKCKKTKIKKEPCLDGAVKGEKSCHTAHPSLHLLKTEKDAFEIVETSSTVPPTSKNGSSSSSSSPTYKKQKSETKFGSGLCSQSPSGDLGRKRNISKISKEQCSEMDRGRRRDHQASGQGDRPKGKEKCKESSRRSTSRERRRSPSISDSYQFSSPERTHRKRQRSQSRDRRSRSGSSCSSREYSKTKKHKKSSRESNERDKECDRRRGSKDKQRGRSSSTSPSRSHSRSRSRSRSKDQKRILSTSKSCSRSRSRERRKDHGRLQQPTLSSRENVESVIKDKSKHRSQSSSRERSKYEGPFRCSQKTPGSCSSSSKSTKQLQDKKKEDNTQSYVKVELFAKVKRQLSSCTSTFKGEKEDKSLRANAQVTASEIIKDMGKKVVKKFKTDRQPPLDMFEGSPVTEPPTKEEMAIPSFTITKCTDEEIKENSIKAVMCEIKSESFEIDIIKSEPPSPEMCYIPTVTSFTASSTPFMIKTIPRDVVSESQPGFVVSAEHPDAADVAVSVKQDVQQHCDYDDDVNVDVMLDNLDYVKSERTEGDGATVKHEKEEGKIEGDQVSAVVGAKSKTQVKRVTWNIQEPEGPQPERSASKLALYKLKLKQEGARRPSSTIQASSQDVTRAVTDPATCSRGDSQHPESLSATEQGEAEEGDPLKKDKYLKKLHMQERAIEEVKLAIKPFYQRRDINKDEYKEILRKAVHKVCHSKSGEINPVKVGNLVKAYVDKYKHARKHKKGEDLGNAPEVQTEPMKTSDSP